MMDEGDRNSGMVPAVSDRLSVRLPGAVALSCRIAFSILLTGFVSCQGIPRSGPARNTGITATLETAKEAWDGMQQADAAAAAEARRDYNQAVARLVNEIAWHERKATWAREMRFGSTGAGAADWRVTFDDKTPQGRPRTWGLAEFARCVPASKLKTRGFHRVAATEGVGVPVVLMQDEPRRVARSFHPPEGEFVSGTAVLEFPPAPAGHPAEARLRFYDPLAVSQVTVGRQSPELSANFTAPLPLSLPESYFDEEEGGLGLHVNGDSEGYLYFPAPYDPAKVPVVLVHGVRSYAAVWKNLVNELLADPELRRRYQPMCFIYPPKLPVPASAACLRRLLARCRAELDPERDDPISDHVVLVGHSMGGLLSRLQATDSGTDMWHAFFAAPPEEIARKVDGDTMGMLRQSLFFEHDPGVARIVFLCTPHLGSELADVNAVRTLLRLVLFLPKEAQRRLQALQRLPSPYIKPELREYRSLGMEGPENATTGHPFFKALARRPIRAPYHSVIAVNGGDELTDGVVPYWSAHLDGAVSETVVHHPHSCLEEPEVMQAVLDILRKHR